MPMLHSEGYQVLPAVFTAFEIDALRQALTDTIDRVAHALRAPFEQSCPDQPLELRLDQVASRDRAYADALRQAVMVDAHRDDRIANLPANRHLAASVQELLAPQVLAGHVIRPRAMLPAFAGTGSPWHQDVLRPTITEAGCGSVKLACWIPLADVDDESGALEVLPGTWSEPLPHLTDSARRFFISDSALPAIAPIAVPVRCGDVLVLGRFVPHRSRTVTKGRGRWAIVMWVKAID